MFSWQSLASGGVAGGANLFPRTFVDLYDAADREIVRQRLVELGAL